MKNLFFYKKMYNIHIGYQISDTRPAMPHMEVSAWRYTVPDTITSRIWQVSPSIGG